MLAAVSGFAASFTAPDGMLSLPLYSQGAALSGIKMALTDMKREPPYLPAVLPSMGVVAGDKAPSFSLLPAGGGPRVALDDLLATKPVLLEFLSVT